MIADLRAPAGQGALLSPPPVDVLGPIERDLLADPTGFDRSQMHAVDLRLGAFFDRNLAP